MEEVKVNEISAGFDNLEPVNNFVELSSEERTSVWDRFTGVGYDYAGLMNIILLIGIFMLAKYIFKSFVMSKKRVGKWQGQNFSYAVSSFSFFISLAFILSSVGYGDVTTSWLEGATKTITYTGLGIALLILTGLIFDKLVINRYSLNKQIAEGNIAAGIFDAGNFFSAALIISSALMWQEIKELQAIFAVLGIYAVSQLILVVATHVRAYFFNNARTKTNFQEEIRNGNTAVAIDFAGRRVGTALAITAATKLLSYQNSFDFTEVVLEWVGVSIILLVILNSVSWVISKVLFWNRDLYQDVLDRNNASALSNVAIYISLGVIIANGFY
jgi:uncharacterized membrane protein YjfL (UPF0719 family)